MVTGSNSNPQIQGTNFAREGVVYVNFNTRESVWASANSKESDGEEVQNFGMLDVEMVMEWVHENIEGMTHDIFHSHSCMTGVLLTPSQPSAATTPTSSSPATPPAPSTSTTTSGGTPLHGSQVPWK